MTPETADTTPPRLSLLSAPHRLAFLVGAVQLVLVMAFWFAELSGRAGLSPRLATTLPSSWAHGWLMIYGLFSFFIYGFLFTVFPRWLAGKAIDPRHYGPVLALATVGVLLIYGGLLIHPSLLGIGLSVFLLAWLCAILVLIAAYRAGTRGGWHARLLLVELTIGAVGQGAFLFGATMLHGGAVRLSYELGLWGFLVPVVLTVAHRVIPFFTQSAIPFRVASPATWSLPVLVGGCFAHALLNVVDDPLARLVVDLGLAGIVAHHSWHWGFHHSLRIRLLAMLHIAFLWFGAAMLLYAIDAALMLTGNGTLGRAPLHALGIGFVTGILVAMATRVTLGHSGRPLVTDGWTWRWFVLLNLVALTRMAAEIVPPEFYLAINLLAAGGWLVCLAPWVLRYAPIYWRQHDDRAPPSSHAVVTPPQKR